MEFLTCQKCSLELDIQPCEACENNVLVHKSIKDDPDLYYWRSLQFLADLNEAERQKWGNR